MSKIITSTSLNLLTFVSVSLCSLITVLALTAQAEELVTENSALASSSGTTTVAETESPANSNQDERGAERQENQLERQENMEARQTDRAQLRTERQTALEEVRQQRILNLAANISNRLDAAVNRLFTIINRLEQRVLKLKQLGVDTALAEARLRAAAVTLAEAKTLLVDIDTLVYDATTSTQPRESWRAVREQYLKIGGLVRQAHQELREMLALLKEAVRQAESGSGVSEAVNDTNISTSTIE